MDEAGPRSLRTYARRARARRRPSRRVRVAAENRHCFARRRIVGREGPDFSLAPRRERRRARRRRQLRHDAPAPWPRRAPRFLGDLVPALPRGGADRGPDRAAVARQGASSWWGSTPTRRIKAIPGEFALAEGLTYPIVHDGKGEASRLYDIANLPTLVVLSRSGKVVAVRVGITDDAEIERLLRRALD